MARQSARGGGGMVTGQIDTCISKWCISFERRVKRNLDGEVITAHVIISYTE